MAQRDQWCVVSAAPGHRFDPRTVATTARMLRWDPQPRELHVPRGGRKQKKERKKPERRWEPEDLRCVRVYRCPFSFHVSDLFPNNDFSTRKRRGRPGGWTQCPVSRDRNSSGRRGFLSAWGEGGQGGRRDGRMQRFSKMTTEAVPPSPRQVSLCPLPLASGWAWEGFNRQKREQLHKRVAKVPTFHTPETTPLCQPPPLRPGTSS